MDSLSNVDVVVLAGGLGTRLRSVVSDKPKVLAPVRGKPFLDHVLESLFAQGLRRVILCVGHMREQVGAYVAERAASDPRFRGVVCSEEVEPLGTGGAIKNAKSLIASDQFFVMNGDTIAHIDFSAMIDFHMKHGGEISIATTRADDPTSSGTIIADANGRIGGFREKTEQGSGFVNAGTYLMNKNVLEKMPSGTFSIETDFFPHAVKEMRCYAFVMDGSFLDIGTPERYHGANNEDRNSLL